MTNTEDTNTPAAFDAVEVPDFIDTPVDFDAEWAQPAQAYRFLNWVNSDKVRKAYSLNLPSFSTARQLGVRDLVNHGLVTERIWTGGKHDGRVTYRVTELGAMRLAQAWEAGSLLVIG